MELDNNIKNELIQLSITPESLSDNEKKIISQIHDVFVKFKNTQEQLQNSLSKNKFNKSIVASKVDCSRQTLYKNPTVVSYLEYLLSKAEKIAITPASEKVSKEKYSQLKKENEQILFNVIDSALKDAELERLNKELKEKNQRIATLVERIEQLNHEKHDAIFKQINVNC